MDAGGRLINQLLVLLKLLSVSQRDVAQRLAINATNISHWKSGDGFPSQAQMTTLQQIVNEAVRKDTERDETRFAEIKTPRERAQFYKHRRNRHDAFVRYRAAVTRWIESVRLGAGYDVLQEQADRIGEVIQGYLTRGIKQLSVDERQEMTAYLRQLDETVYLINVLEVTGDRPSD